MITELKIEGMTCGHCVTAIRKALETVPGVENAEVSLGEGRARVEGHALLKTLIEAVEEEGYTAVSR